MSITYTGSTPQKEMEKINGYYRKLMILSIVMVVIAVAALVAALFKAMLPSVILLVIVLVIRLTVHRKVRGDYQQAITDATLTCSVGAKLDQFDLSPKGGIGITREDVRAAQLLPVMEEAESFIGFYQGIAGTAKDLEVSLNDTTLRLNQLVGAKGTGVSCGIWMHFVLKGDTGRNFRILSDDFLPGDIRKDFFGRFPDLTERDPVKAGLGRDYCLYEGDAAAGSLLPASITSTVKELSRNNPGNIALSLKGNTLNIFVRDRVLSPNYRLNSKPTEKILQIDPIPEFKSVFSMVKGL